MDSKYPDWGAGYFICRCRPLPFVLYTSSAVLPITVLWVLSPTLFGHKDCGINLCLNHMRHRQDCKVHLCVMIGVAGCCH